ncbi:MAG: hypothetical protein B7X34_02115, partial [Acidobacteriia bacterium 12-62-4]
MIVMKFGGSSVESAVAIARVAEIVRSRLAEKPVVVVSAMGKTTNALLAAAELAADGQRDAAQAALDALEAFTLGEAHASLRGFIALHFQELGAFLDELTQIGDFP